MNGLGVIATSCYTLSITVQCELNNWFWIISFLKLKQISIYIAGIFTTGTQSPKRDTTRFSINLAISFILKRLQLACLTKCTLDSKQLLVKCVCSCVNSIDSSIDSSKTFNLKPIYVVVIKQMWKIYLLNCSTHFKKNTLCLNILSFFLWLEIFKKNASDFVSKYNKYNLKIWLFYLLLTFNYLVYMYVHS